MSRKITVTLVAVLLSALAVTGPATAQEETTAMKDSVRRIRDAYFASYKAGDAAAAASLFASDGVLMPPAAPAVRGREQVQKRLEGFFEGQTVSLGVISEETLVAGDRVLDRGILTVEVKQDGAEKSSSDTGKYVLMAVKKAPEDGQEAWRIRWLIWSTDHPMQVSGGREEEG